MLLVLICIWTSASLSHINPSLHSSLSPSLPSTLLPSLLPPSLPPSLLGADLANMVNQAALKGSADGHEHVTMEDFEHAKDKIIMGREWEGERMKDLSVSWLTFKRGEKVV